MTHAPHIPRFRSPFAEHNDVIRGNGSTDIFADPTADRLRIPGMNRCAARTRTTYLVSDRLHAGRTVRVAVHEIASTVSAWLAELGVRGTRLVVQSLCGFRLVGRGPL